MPFPKKLLFVAMLFSPTFTFAGWISSKVCGPEIVITHFLNTIGAPVVFDGRSSNQYVNAEDEKPKDTKTSDISSYANALKLLGATSVDLKELSHLDYGVFFSSPCTDKVQHPITKEPLTCFIRASGGATYDKARGHYTANGPLDTEIKGHLGCDEIKPGDYKFIILE